MLLDFIAILPHLCSSTIHDFGFSCLAYVSLAFFIFAYLSCWDFIPLEVGREAVYICKDFRLTPGRWVHGVWLKEHMASSINSVSILQIDFYIQVV